MAVERNRRCWPEAEAIQECFSSEETLLEISGVGCVDPNGQGHDKLESVDSSDVQMEEVAERVILDGTRTVEGLAEVPRPPVRDVVEEKFEQGRRHLLDPPGLKVVELESGSGPGQEYMGNGEAGAAVTLAAGDHGGIDEVLFGSDDAEFGSTERSEGAALSLGLQACKPP